MSETNFKSQGGSQLMVMGVIYLMLYRLSIIATGALSIYLGYRLFLSGLFPYAIEGSEFNAEILGNTFTLRNAAPGIFFALFGVIVIAIMILRSPPEVSFSTNRSSIDPETGETVNYQARGIVELAEEFDDDLSTLPGDRG